MIFDQFKTGLVIEKRVGAETVRGIITQCDTHYVWVLWTGCADAVVYDLTDKGKHFSTWVHYCHWNDFKNVPVRLSGKLNDF